MEIPNGVMIIGTTIFARPALTKQEAIHRICFIYSRLRDDNSIKGFYDPHVISFMSKWGITKEDIDKLLILLY